MKKGYTETMPLDSHDPQGLPIWGASVPAETTKKKATQREQRAEEIYERNSQREVPWRENIRTARSTMAGYQWINFEGVYRGFRQRLLNDPEFEGQILEMILDRLMAELFVPAEYSPGQQVPLHRRKIKGVP